MFLSAEGQRGNGFPVFAWHPHLPLAQCPLGMEGDLWISLLSSQDIYKHLRFEGLLKKQKMECINS